MSGDGVPPEFVERGLIFRKPRNHYVRLSTQVEVVMKTG
jgi:hypothetical protein